MISALKLPRAQNMRARSKPVRTPTVLQMEIVECGAAALAIIMGYYGKWVGLDELRIACGVSRDGSKASNVVKAARTYGFEARGLRRELASVWELPMPIIAHWNFNHFLVVEGRRNDRVYLNDPATGRRTISLDAFDKGFTGVVLSVRPDANFAASGDRPSTLRAFAPHMKLLKPVLFLIAVLGIMLTLAGSATAVFSRVFIDYYVKDGVHAWVLPLLVVMAGVALFTGVAVWMQQHHLVNLESRLAVSLSSRFVWRMLRLPIEFFAQRQPGEIVARIDLNERLSQILSNDLATTVIQAALIFIYAVLMSRYDVTLTAITVAIAAVNLAVLRLVATRRADANQSLMHERGKVISIMSQGMQAIETLKAGGTEQDFFERWAGYQAKMTNSEQQLGLPVQWLKSVPPMLTALNVALILGYGGWQVIEGRIGLGTLIAFQLLSAMFMRPLNQLINLIGKFQDAQSALVRIDDLFRYPLPAAEATLFESLSAEAAVGQTEARLTGHLNLQSVTFGYNRMAEPLIKDFSLTVRPGTRVALVGGSGSGKSTIARLVAGLYQPWSGNILFDGKPREAVARAILNQSVAMVDQDSFLFEDSLRDNLSLWDETIAEDQMLAAIEDAQLYDEVFKRPGGLDCAVKEGGANFSGGQRQRIEIARALVKNPSLLVLDEATSALDPILEKRIDERLRRRGCTCLIVAHRLSTIRDCDEIIVLQAGRIAQRGTHETLIRDVDGFYARLVRSEEQPSSARARAAVDSVRRFIAQSV